MSQKCKLCQNRDANQTGSHLTSCFIVSSLIGTRDNEEGFMITNEPNQDYSENIGAEGIKEDYILCIGCERRLSFIESYFSQEFTNKIGKDNFANNFPIIELEDDNSSKFFQCNNVNPIAFHLLIYSIIWRASISTKPIFSGFNLDEDSLEQLRFTLDLYLPEYKEHKIIPKLKIWLQDITDVPDFFTFSAYLILKCEKKDTESDTTKNLLFFTSDYTNPYHIILNEFIILPFFNGGNIDFRTQDFFELNDKYDLKGQMNTELNAPKVGILTDEDWNRINAKLLDIQVKQRVDKIKQECLAYFLRKKVSPTSDQFNKCVSAKINEIGKIKS